MSNKKLSKKQEELLKKRLNIKSKRGATFCGFRPVVFNDKSKYSKKDRVKNKIL